MHAIETNDAGARPPITRLAVGMAVLASVAQNIITASIFGTFGVLAQPLQQRFDATPEMTFAAMTLVICGAAAFASMVGILAKRIPLRVLFATGAALSASAWIILALTTSYVVYMLVFGLLLAPAMALNVMVLPATLTARWFPGRIGLVLGLVFLPVLPIVFPVASNHLFETQGIETLFVGLGALSALFVFPALFLIRDHPPGREPAVITPGHAESAGTHLSLGKLVTDPRFLIFAFLLSIANSGSNILSVHLVQMARSWHIGRSDAALLTSIVPLLGIAGPVVFGWLADRIGGGRALMLIACNGGLLWALLLLHPPFFALGGMVGLIGLHCAGGMPAASRAIADTFGADDFSSVFGLCTSASVPIAALAVFLAASVNQHLGSYVPVLAALAVLGVGGALCSLLVKTDARALPAAA